VCPAYSECRATSHRGGSVPIAHDAYRTYRPAPSARRMTGQTHGVKTEHPSSPIRSVLRASPPGLPLHRLGQCPLPHREHDDGPPFCVPLADSCTSGPCPGSPRSQGDWQSSSLSAAHGSKGRTVMAPTSRRGSYSSKQPPFPDYYRTSNISTSLLKRCNAYS